MKRFHVHIAVEDLAANIDFYNKLFGSKPAKQRVDYAKWMLDDPAVNFAISTRGHQVGVNHLGVQVSDAGELATLRQYADAASNETTLDQGEAACCYARSEKHWTVDPQGIAWEHFLTMDDAETYGTDTGTPMTACCVPLRSDADGTGDCCVPGEAQSNKAEPCCS